MRKVHVYCDCCGADVVGEPAFCVKITHSSYGPLLSEPKATGVTIRLEAASSQSVAETYKSLIVCDKCQKDAAIIGAVVLKKGRLQFLSSCKRVETASIEGKS